MSITECQNQERLRANRRLSFDNLPVDVLLTITSHLTPDAAAPTALPQSQFVITISALSQTTRALRAFAMQNVWPHFLARHPRPCVMQRDYSDLMRAWKIGRTDAAWRSVQFDASRCDIPPQVVFHDRNGRSNDQWARSRSSRSAASRSAPFLLLAPQGLLLTTRDEVWLWPRMQLSGSAASQMDIRSAQHFYLRSADGMTTQWNDVSACCVLPLPKQDSCIDLCVGRVDGSVEHWVLPLDDGRTQASSRERHAILHWSQSNVAKRSGSGRPASVPQGLTVAHSIDSVHASPTGHVAFASKCGTISLWRVSLAEAGAASTPSPRCNVEWRCCADWQISTNQRIWSVLLDHHARWLAVGTTGTRALVVYPLHQTSHKPLAPLELLSSGRSTSVFALCAPSSSMQPTAQAELYAGFYDGVVRAYDISEALRRANASSDALDITNGVPTMAHLLDEISELSPTRTYRDPFDPSPIYSICFGGGNNSHILAGTARNGQLKVWDIHQNASPTTKTLTANMPISQESGRQHTKEAGYSIFAAQGSKAPTYTLVADYDRVWGATDRQVWQLDFDPRPRSRIQETTAPPSKQHASKRGRRPRYQGSQAHDSGTVHFYRHGDMTLETVKSSTYAVGKA